MQGEEPTLRVFRLWREHAEVGVDKESWKIQVHINNRRLRALPDSELHRMRRHPDYEYTVTEGPRKAWDYADEPPIGDDGKPDPSWECNTDAGDNGWARFDYTEESYWRRRKGTGRPLKEW